jgi:hypothetical protein
MRLLQRGATVHIRGARAISAIAAHADPTGLVSWVWRNGGRVDGVSVAAQPEPLGYGLVATEVCVPCMRPDGFCRISLTGAAQRRRHAPAAR